MSLARQLILSLFILFHLLVLLIWPIQSYWKSVPSAISLYANNLGLVGQWSFFAPQATVPLLFFEWELTSENEAFVHHGRWPDDIQSLFFRERLNRQVMMSHFIFQNNIQIEKIFIPYLCQSKNTPDFPGTVNKVKLWKEGVPPFSLNEMNQQNKFNFYAAYPSLGRALVTEAYCKGFRK